MSRYNKFYAVSAIYLGLASAVGAQGSGTAAGGNASGAVQASPSGQRSSLPAGPSQRNPARNSGQSAPGRFEHPMLEREGSAGTRPSLKSDRIQRRGEGGYRNGDIRNGDIQRNPGSPRAPESR